ncbi:calcium-activated potassium channel subunit beta-2-like isoform X2 [Salarias fasciatus]|uniref:calcium-activated potassium channel subunit beta-2-like isoform X2 n=1 Tax=Salarias fasciatus TaxID=181472 RepID=UPI001176DDD0|nr:calcium-activated potassium channel subunit beta-2-like isoform X2 [Salarias fasciatus]
MLQQRSFKKAGTPSRAGWAVSSGAHRGLPLHRSSGSMFLWVGNKAPDEGGRKSIYQKICEHQALDKRRTVTALRPGEDRATLLGLSMVLFSAMMYFVLGVTVLRSHSDSVWTDENSCTVVNSTIVWDVNCSYSCGAECWRRSQYPCLQVYVRINSSDRVVRLLHNEEAHERNPECFYIPKCQKDYSATHAVVQNVSRRLRSQRRVQCFVDPGGRSSSALLAPFYGRAAVFYSLFWPTCVLVGGTAIVAMVKLTQYLSIRCERQTRTPRSRLIGTRPLTGTEEV